MSAPWISPKSKAGMKGSNGLKDCPLFIHGSSRLDKFHADFCELMNLGKVKAKRDCCCMGLSYALEGQLLRVRAIRWKQFKNIQKVSSLVALGPVQLLDLDPTEDSCDHFCRN